MNHQQAILLDSRSLERAIDYQPLTVSPGQQVTEVVALMEQTGQDCALVQENQQLVGILTEKELIKLVARGTPLTEVTLTSIMTKNPLVISVSQLQDWIWVISLWQEQQITHLPIVDGANRPVGVITTSTFLPSLLQTVPKRLTSQQLPTTKKLTWVGLTEFQAMFNALSEAVIFADPHRRIQMVNPAALNLFGYQLSELIGEQTAILYASQAEYERQGRRRFNLNAMEQREPYEVNYRSSNGVEFVGETVGTVVKDDVGEIIGFLGIIRDVTQQKNTERQLHNTEYLMQKISETSPNLFYIYDLHQKRNIYANRELASALGYTPKAIEEMGHEIYGHLFHPDELSRISAHHQKIAICKEQELFEIEYRVRHANGEWLWFYSWEVVFARDGSGFPTQILGTAVNITKRKQLELELECFFSLSLDLFCVASADGYLKRINPAFEKVIGYSQKELLSQPFIDFVHPDDREATLTELKKLTRGRPTVNFENRYRCQGGTYKWLAWNAFPAPEEGILYAVARDITEQKKAEQVLRLTQFSVEHAGDAVFWIDKNGQFVYVNEAACQSLGYSRSELMQMGVPDIDPNFPQSAWPLRWQEVTAKQSLTVDSIHQTKNGTCFPVEVRGNYLVFEQQEYICAFARDIRDRQIATAALKASQERFELAMRGSGDGLWDWDPKTNEVYYSRRFKEILGYQDQEFANHFDSWVEHIHPDERLNVMEALYNHLYHSSSYDIEYRLRTKSGQYRWIRARGQAIWNEQGRATRMAGSIGDITPLKEAESALHRTNQELERRVEQRTAELTRSNQELEQFAYIVSHDLQEPLRKMKSFSQLLAKECQGQLTDNEKVHRYLDYIIDAAERQRNLIQALLNYSRLGRNDSPKVSIDLGAVIEKVLEDLSVTIVETQATITVSELPTVQASATQMAQLFLNLIGNGIKFRGEASPSIRIEAQLQPEEWLISVQDNGIGIKPQYAKRIFQIFQRLHSRSEYSGTGIGLAICRKIVEDHGGRIWVASEPGQGSTFYFTLPVSSGFS